jgi:type II secretory pathway component GspD/PulD (secretin)
LFKRKDVQRNTNEILFFITPRIIRPDYAVAPGSSGTRTGGSIIQPVPMGNPNSNSDGTNNQLPLPSVQPAPATVPVKP